MKKIILIIYLIQLYFPNFSNSQLTYFPPIGSDSWKTIPISQLGWDESKIEPFFNFLNQKNTKAFILLKDGKIVIEKYFDSFNKDSIWYWASAGKTLTSALVGIAQQDGLLNLNDKTSKYLGNGWTSCPIDKEDLITVRHQLTMTTGLDYKVEDLDCTDPECLKYRADAGSQWYYHNAPYTLLEKVVEKATGLNYNLYFTQKIRNQIGMNGIWLKLGYNNVYFSNARSMARYGILIANNGFWEDKNIIKDKAYLNQIINTSQELNKSYGYLWWLNGKESCMIPGSSMVFNSMLMPDAPKDVYAALGKDGQILNISPSTGIIWVRMGERPDNQFFISTNFSNDVWQYLNQIIKPLSVTDQFSDKNIIISSNPALDYIEITSNMSFPSNRESEIKIYNTLGECVMKVVVHCNVPLQRIDISHLPVGIYFIKIGDQTEKFMVVR